MIEKYGLHVHPLLVNFIAVDALPGTGVSEDQFWSGFAAILNDLAPKNCALLKKRDDLQVQIDAWKF
jgi:malate synthase